MVEFGFEKLIAWQKARKLYKKIRELTSTFPNSERYDLTSQMNRASHGICSCLAEGSGRKTNKDKLHYVNMSYASLLELVSDLILSFDNKYISEVKLKELKTDCQELSKILSGLKRSLL